MILSLDVATTVGFCFGEPGASPEWGSRHFGGKGQTNGEIIATFRQWVNQRCYDIRPKLICYESPYIPTAPRFRKNGGRPPMNPAVLRRLLGMTGVVEAVCFELRVECSEARTQEFTKFMTGTSRHGGREEKKAAVMDACSFYGFDTNGDNDSADAIALWLYAESILYPDVSVRRRRLAADHDRDKNGAGPLFQVQKQSVPRLAPRDAKELVDMEVSSCPNSMEM